MKKGAIVVVGLSTVLLTSTARADARADGRAVFEMHCSGCHTAGEGVGEPDATKKAALDWTRQCPECTPDLSGVGRRRKADWLKAYLKNEKKGRNGLKHNELPVTVEGKPLILRRSGPGLPLGATLSGEDMGALVQWLLTLTASPVSLTPPSPTVPEPTARSSSAAPVSLAHTEAPDMLQAAKTIAVVGKTGTQMSNRAMWNPNGERARQKVEAVLSAWGRYAIVERPEDADLLVIVTEYQKNLSLVRRANLVAELKVYRGGQEPMTAAPLLWSADASEGLAQPATKVAEKFRDFVNGLQSLSKR